eukprot:2375563-Karenia_brevis.AAC.1
MHGPRETASKRVNKVLSLLRPSTPNGAWRKVVAKSPNGMDQQIYLAPDKSRKQTRLEFYLRKGKKILEHMCDTKIFTNKLK